MVIRSPQRTAISVFLVFKFASTSSLGNPHPCIWMKVVALGVASCSLPSLLARKEPTTSSNQPAFCTIASHSSACFSCRREKPRRCQRRKGCYFGKSVGGGRSADGEASSENWGYAAFRASRPQIEPKHTISSIRVPPTNPKANGLKKKDHRANV